MTLRVLQVGRLMPSLEQRLAAAWPVTRLADEPDPQVHLATHGPRYDALVTSAPQGAGKALLDALPGLRVVSSFGVGLDKIDLAAAAARGIAVGYTPDVLNDCVADHAFALMLAVARRVAEGDRHVRRGDWGRAGSAPLPLGRKVSGARLGIVGLGRIGQTIARRASGFDMAVRYHARRVVPGVAWAHEPSLPALARWADFLVVITAGGPATHHLIDAEVLHALGPDGFLVNVARGSVVDEAALVAALAEGRIAGAGLDVFEREPAVPDALKTMDHVVLMPHTASATRETREAMARRVIDNLQAHVDGRPMPSPVPMHVPTT